ncbi:unnamed protein product [Phaeothamnion confervicola]
MQLPSPTSYRGGRLPPAAAAVTPVRRRTRELDKDDDSLPPEELESPRKRAKQMEEAAVAGRTKQKGYSGAAEEQQYTSAAAYARLSADCGFGGGPAAAGDGAFALGTAVAQRGGSDNSNADQDATTVAALSTLQRAGRSFVTRLEADRRRKSAVLLQQHGRAFAARGRHRRSGAALRVQATFRGYRARARLRRERELRRGRDLAMGSAAVLIQSASRGRLARLHIQGESPPPPSPPFGDATADGRHSGPAAAGERFLHGTGGDNAWETHRRADFDGAFGDDGYSAGGDDGGNFHGNHHRGFGNKDGHGRDNGGYGEDMGDGSNEYERSGGRWERHQLGEHGDESRELEDEAGEPWMRHAAGQPSSLRYCGWGEEAPGRPVGPAGGGFAVLTDLQRGGGRGGGAGNSRSGYLGGDGGDGDSFDPIATGRSEEANPDGDGADAAAAMWPLYPAWSHALSNSTSAESEQLAFQRERLTASAGECMAALEAAVWAQVSIEAVRLRATRGVRAALAEAGCAVLAAAAQLQREQRELLAASFPTTAQPQYPSASQLESVASLAAGGGAAGGGGAAPDGSVGEADKCSVAAEVWDRCGAMLLNETAAAAAKAAAAATAAVETMAAAQRGVVMFTMGFELAPEASVPPALERISALVVDAMLAARKAVTAARPRPGGHSGSSGSGGGRSSGGGGRSGGGHGSVDGSAFEKHSAASTGPAAAASMEAANGARIAILQAVEVLVADAGVILLALVEKGEVAEVAMAWRTASTLVALAQATDPAAAAATPATAGASVAAAGTPALGWSGSSRGHGCGRLTALLLEDALSEAEAIAADCAFATDAATLLANEPSPAFPHAESQRQASSAAVAETFVAARVQRLLDNAAETLLLFVFEFGSSAGEAELRRAVGTVVGGVFALLRASKPLLAVSGPLPPPRRGSEDSVVSLSSSAFRLVRRPENTVDAAAAAAGPSARRASKQGVTAGLFVAMDLLTDASESARRDGGGGVVSRGISRGGGGSAAGCSGGDGDGGGGGGGGTSVTADGFEPVAATLARSVLVGAAQCDWSSPELGSPRGSDGSFNGGQHDDISPHMVRAVASWEAPSRQRNASAARTAATASSAATKEQGNSPVRTIGPAEEHGATAAAPAAAVAAAVAAATANARSVASSDDGSHGAAVQGGESGLPSRSKGDSGAHLKTPPESPPRAFAELRRETTQTFLPAGWVADERGDLVVAATAGAAAATATKEQMEHDAARVIQRAERRRVAAAVTAAAVQSAPSFRVSDGMGGSAPLQDEDAVPTLVVTVALPPSSVLAAIAVPPKGATPWGSSGETSVPLLVKTAESAQAAATAPAAMDEEWAAITIQPGGPTGGTASRHETGPGGGGRSNGRAGGGGSDHPAGPAASGHRRHCSRRRRRLRRSRCATDDGLCRRGEPYGRRRSCLGGRRRGAVADGAASADGARAADAVAVAWCAAVAAGGGTVGRRPYTESSGASFVWRGGGSWC